MSGRAWLALDGRALRVWPDADSTPVPGAWRIDARMVDPDGPAQFASLVLVDGALPMDDLAVQQARREVLSMAEPLRITTLLDGDRLLRGSLAVGAIHDDPFARLGRQRLLSVPAGVLAGPGPPLAGPSIERYGSANPWPGDRFADVAPGR